MRVYTDTECIHEVGADHLWEGATYYVDLRDQTETERQRLIDNSRIAPFAQFHPKNRICPFKIDGFVGRMGIGEKSFDVRSRKFQFDQSGDQQFRTLLAEIDAIQAGLIFRYDAPTRREAVEKTGAHQPSVLERLDYFAAAFDETGGRESVPRIVKRILRNPHHAIRTAPFERPIETARRLDVARYVRAFARRELCRVEPSSCAASSPAVLRSANGEPFLPTRVPTRPAYIHYDTAENRFLKFYLQDIESVCLSVLRDRQSPTLALADARSLLDKIRALLSDPVFGAIGKLQHLPSHSPVLVGSEAYNRIYESYLRSRLGVVDPLNNARRQLRSSPLKDVATLYEIWVFFRIARAFFGDGADVLVSGQRHSGLPYGTSWRSGDTAITYNRSFSPLRGSYSVTLRPDVTVEIGDQLWLFDAKYKSDRSANIDDLDEGSISAAVKKIDIHKMHTYIDAIARARAAMAVYPGTETTLFPRASSSEDPMLDLCSHGGVGGIPLVPSHPSEALDRAVLGIRAAAS